MLNYTIDDLVKLIGLKEIEIALLRSRVAELEKGAKVAGSEGSGLERKSDEVKLKR